MEVRLVERVYILEKVAGDFLEKFLSLIFNLASDLRLPTSSIVYHIWREICIVDIYIAIQSIFYHIEYDSCMSSLAFIVTRNSNSLKDLRCEYET